MFIIDVVTAFKKQKIKYAVVGGLAVALHNVVRGTFDLDIIIQISKESFEKAEKTLRSLGLVSKLPVSAREIYEFREEYIKNRNLIAWSFYNPQNPIELVDIIITHDVTAMQTKTVYLKKNIEIEILEIGDLIRMKKASGRP